MEEHTRTGRAPLLVLISVAITFADPADDFIETPLALITSICSPPAVVTVVVPLGISPAMILFGKTCLKGTAVNASLSFNKPLRSSAGILSNASFVGANTVNSPGSLSVLTKSAAWTAVTNVDRAGVAMALLTMVSGAAAVLPDR